MKFLLFLQFFSGVGLIATVLLHTAKGEGMGSIGGQARLFGAPKGMEAGLDRLTTVLAVTFLVLSAVIGIFGLD